MIRHRALTILAVLFLLGPSALSSLAAGTNAAGYDLSWHTLEAGGYSAGAGFSLSAAVGQPDGGRLSGGGYSLAGGFLSGAVNLRLVYLPVVLRNQ